MSNVNNGEGGALGTTRQLNSIIRRQARTFVLGLVLPVLLVGSWSFASDRSLIDPALLPAPNAVWTTFAGMVSDGSMLVNIQATGIRLAWGFLAGTLSATLIGGLCGMSRSLQALLDPTLQGLRSVPSLAWVPLFIIWFGIFDASKILLIAVGVFFPIYLNLAEALLSVDRKLLEVGQVHSYDRLRTILRIQLPASLPAYFIGLRSGLGLGWMFVASAEMMGASDGLGYILINGEQVGRPDQVIVAIIAFAILGKITDQILFRGTTKLVSWQDNLKA